MSSVLDTHRPERLVDELDLEDLRAGMLDGTDWLPHQLTAADYVLCHWVPQFAAQNDARSVAELQSVIGQVLEQRAPPEPYAARWRAFDDALEARRLVLVARDPERVAAMKHVKRILDHVREHGPTKQGELLERLALGISVSRLSQIVSLMEAHGLVEVRRRGRESFLVVPAERMPRASAAAVSRAEAEPTTRSLLKIG